MALPSLCKAEEAQFQLRYLLASSLYGYAELADIMPEVRKTGATAIDLWPMVHGNQREQLDTMGEARFAEMLAQHNVTLGCITQYKLGPFGLQDEMQLASRLGCRTIVTGGSGPAGLRGAELKSAVREFVEKMNPHVAIAEETGVTIAIENHRHNLFESADSLKWLAELRPNKHLAVALSPAHLPQDERAIATLILALEGSLAMFYAWQRGADFLGQQSREQGLLQLPGRGELDFGPLLAALAKIQYDGWTEIFMHPYPRGVAIADTVAGVTTAVNQSRRYLINKLKR